MPLGERSGEREWECPNEYCRREYPPTDFERIQIHLLEEIFGKLESLYKYGRSSE